MDTKEYSKNYAAGYLLFADNTAIIHVRSEYSEKIDRYTKINVCNNNSLNNKFNISLLLPDIALACLTDYIEKYNTSNGYIINYPVTDTDETYRLYSLAFPDMYNNIKFSYIINTDLTKELLHSIIREYNLSEDINIIARYSGIWNKINLDEYPKSITFDDINKLFPNTKHGFFKDIEDLMICNETIYCKLE